MYYYNLQFKSLFNYFLLVSIIIYIDLLKKNAKNKNKNKKIGNKA